ncbi:hypothetical protein LINPERHAP1_LOCUS13910 [Linum perenne]
MNLESPLSARLLKSKYYHRTNFLKAKKGPRPSWIWTSLCYARDVLDLGTIRVIKNDRTTSLDSDSWIPSLPSLKLNADVGPFKMVDEWINEDTSQWDMSLVHAFCNNDQSLTVKMISIGPANLEDKWR